MLEKLAYILIDTIKLRKNIPKCGKIIKNVSQIFKNIMQHKPTLKGNVRRSKIRLKDPAATFATLAIAIVAGP